MTYLTNVDTVQLKKIGENMPKDENCTEDTLSAADLLSELPTWAGVLLTICGILTAFTCVLYVEELFHLFRNVPDWRRRTKTIWLLGLYPVFTITSLLGTIIPRASSLVDFVAAIYLSVCIYEFVQLMINYYGGADKMCEALSAERIPLRSPPIACCCCCCPKIRLSKKNLMRVELSVMQVVILRPIFMFIAAVLWADGVYTPGKINYDNAYLYIIIPNSASTLIAMYGLILIYRVSRQPLKDYSITPKFIMLQLVIIFSNLQSAILGFLGGPLSVLSCEKPFSANTRSEMINHMLLISEMTVLSILARWVYNEKISSLNQDDESASVGVFELAKSSKLNSTATSNYGSNSTNTFFESDSSPSEKLLGDDVFT